MVLKIISITLYALWIIIFFIFTSLNARDKNCKIIKRIVVIFGLFTYLFVMTTIFIEPFVETKEENNSSSNSSNYSTEQTFYYEMTATAVNENTFVTEDGNMWRMKNINIEKGKKYQLTFDNHDTEIITDDEIIDFIELDEKVD